ncbi:MAG TPA: hypothetical protein VK982_06315 [Bacteroidales bacterium]|nr:hypothetical protein [Bacteroidales bacterium]
MSNQDGFYHTLKELNNSLKNLFKGSPSVTFMLFCIGVITTYYVLSFSLTLLTGFAVLLVVATSLIVYFNTKNYGEASLSLVAGLLTIFTVEWTVSLSIVFIISWIAFTSIALMIYSVILAAKSEDIYLQAAQFMSNDPDKTDDIQEELEDIAKNLSGLLGPIERAEALRVLSFRKVPLDQMGSYLKAIDQISAITKVDYIEVSNFFGELYRLMDVTPDNQFKPTIDGIYDIMKQTPAHPKEYMEVFKQTRRLVLNGEIELIRLLYGLQEALTRGETQETVYEYLTENVAE